MVNGLQMAERTVVLDGRGRPLSPPSVTPDNGRIDLRQATAEARHALEEAIVATTVAAERALTYAEMLDEALAVLVETTEAPPALPAKSVPRRPTEALSRREQEVLALVAEGLTNKVIAEALYVSPNTVKTHVASLLTKLHADSRVQLAAIATKRGLLYERVAHRGAEGESSLPTAEAPQMCHGQLPDEDGRIGIDHHAASTAPYRASASRPDRRAMVPAG